MRTRIGIFFAWLGGVLILLFIISIIGDSARLEYLLFGILAFFFGAAQIRRSLTPSPPSQRFSLLRRLSQKKSKETQEK